MGGDDPGGRWHRGSRRWCSTQCSPGNHKAPRSTQKPVRWPTQWSARWIAGRQQSSGTSVREHTPSNTDVGSTESLRRKDLHLQGQCRTALKLAGKLIAWRCLNAIAPGMIVHIMDPSGHWSQLHHASSPFFFAALWPAFDWPQR